jgi:hypothetical protein
MVKLELSLHARNLQNVAGALKGTSDPFAVVTKLATTSDEKAEVLGQTEAWVWQHDGLTWPDLTWPEQLLCSCLNPSSAFLRIKNTHSFVSSCKFYITLFYITYFIYSSVNNTLSPEWVKIFTFEYQLGSPQKLAITLFDEVQKGENRSMGAAVFDVGTLLGSRGGVQAKKTKGGGK